MRPIVGPKSISSLKAGLRASGNASASTIGRKRSSAQITEHYTLAQLPGLQVAAVVNFPPRQIGKFMSEVLTLGFPDAEGKVVLFHPSEPVPDGGRLF